jgi:hypothetical protein
VTHLPLEIALLILDNLCELTDIRGALAVFRWHVPPLYWKTRVPMDLVFELDDVDDLDALDWKSFYWGILQDIPSFRNRQRIADLLEEVRTRFVERLASTETAVPI